MGSGWAVDVAADGMVPVGCEAWNGVERNAPSTDGQRMWATDMDSGIVDYFPHEIAIGNGLAADGITDGITDKIAIAHWP
jgi:hypothetical protein